MNIGTNMLASMPTMNSISLRSKYGLLAQCTLSKRFDTFRPIPLI